MELRAGPLFNNQMDKWYLHQLSFRTVFLNLFIPLSAQTLAMRLKPHACGAEGSFLESLIGS